MDDVGLAKREAKGFVLRGQRDGMAVGGEDQLGLAVSYTAYCLLAPRLKERRFAARYGDRFARYRAAVPYALPPLRAKGPPDAQ